jgi:hypothetical protein
VAPGAIGGLVSYGVITKLRGDTIFFMYNSIGTQY